MRPPEEVKLELVRQWVTMAEQDLGLAEHLCAEDAPYLEAIGFHAQQAAEKFLKAFLVRHQIDFPKTHDLDNLLNLVAVADEQIADSLRDTTILTDYSVDIRYPSDIPEMTPEEARRAVDLAGKVRKSILSALGGYLKEGV